MRFLLVIMLIMFGFQGFSQEKEVTIFATVKNDDTGKRLSSAMVEVYCEGKLVTKAQSPASGKVPPMYVETGKTYRIFVKKNGYVTKMAEVNANIDFLEDVDGDLAINFVVSIFERVEGVDFSYLESTPMTKFFFDNTFVQQYDEAYTKAMLEKIKELKRQIREKKEEQADKDNEVKKTEADFQAYVDAGDAAMNTQKYEVAVNQYGLALGLRKDDKVVQQKLAEAKKLLAEQQKLAEKEKAYQAKMTEALAAFKSNEWEQALGLYKEASEMMKDKPDPKIKIKEIEQILEKEKALLAQIAVLEKAGDDAVSKEEYDIAISKYSEALGLRSPNEQIKIKLDKAKELKAEKEKSDKNQAKIDAEYASIMKSADKLFDEKKYEDSKSKYEAAKALKSNEERPPIRIKEIETLLKGQAALAEKKAAFNEKMTLADEAFSNKDWDKALKLYQEASAIKNDEQKPKDQIIAIKIEIEKVKKLQEEYNKIVAEGNMALNVKDYKIALDKYKSAKVILDTKEINEKINAAQKGLDEADELARLKAAQQKKYENAIADGNKNRDDDNLESALTSYKLALEIKNDDAVAKSEINKINKIISDRAAELAAKSKSDLAYKALLADADKLLTLDKLDDAKSKYTIALKEQPDDEYPKEKLKIIAEKQSSIIKQKAIDKAYQEAITKGESLKNKNDIEQAIATFQKAKEIKPEESLPQQKIDELNKILNERKSAAEKEKLFQTLISEANDLRGQKSWVDAKSKYNEAITVKPNDSYAIDEISKIDKILAEEKLAEEKNHKFEELVDEGDDKFVEEDYPGAVESFNEALEIKEDEKVKEKVRLSNNKIIEDEKNKEQEVLFAQKLNEAEELFNAKKWNEALVVFNELKNEKTTLEIDNRIESIESELAKVKEEQAKSEKVVLLTSEAEKFELSNDFDKALNTYEEAYSIRSDQQIKDHITRVKEKLDKLKAAEKLISYYQSKIDEADAKFREGKWDEAIEIYKIANSIKEDEDYPKEQIIRCNKNKKLAQDRVDQEAYNKVIDKAQILLNDKKYDEALVSFEKAASILPNETYPKIKIDDIKKIQKNLSDKELAKNTADQKFNQFIRDADAAYNSQNFEKAIESYQAAIKIKPTDRHANDKIASSKSKLDALNKAKELASKYNSFIAKGDQLMKAERWNEAIKAYKNAQVYDPKNEYPNTQINKAKNAIESESILTSEDAYAILLKDAQEKYDSKLFDESLRLYKKAYSQNGSDDIVANRISELNQILSNQKKNVNNKNRHKQLIANADQLFEKKKWAEAKVFYIQAYSLGHDTYSESQIKRIEKIHKTFETAQYDKMIAKANEYFKAENYQKAKGLYKRAIKTFKTINTSYPKSQIKKINKILNPPELAKSGSRPPVGKKVNKSEEEMQRLFENAEEQRSIGKSIDLMNKPDTRTPYILEWKTKEQNENYIVIEKMASATEKLYDFNFESDHKIESFVDLSESYSALFQASMLNESAYTNNVIFRQGQIVENIDREIAENSFKFDNNREEFEPVIESIIDQIVFNETDEKNDQNNVIHKQIKKLDDFDENKDVLTKNIEIGRKNSELEINNIQVRIKNRELQENWKEEDNIHATSIEANKIKSSQAYATINNDIPRQETEELVTSIVDNTKSGIINNIDNQYDNLHSSIKKVDQIEIDQFEFDENAQNEAYKMEVIQTATETAIQEANKNLELENVDQIYITSEELGNIKSEQDKVHDDKTLQLQQDNDEINKISNDIQIKAQNQIAHSENERHFVENKTELIKKISSNNNDDNNAIADEVSDNILKNEDIIARDQIDQYLENEKELNKVEDFIVSIADIDISAISEKVKNELGTKFPAGITQEIYERNDKDGLLISFVVRRVVVIEGEGNVYEKTKTKYGVSYSKNGQAISSYTWENETEDANLVFH